MPVRAGSLSSSDSLNFSSTDTRTGADKMCFLFFVSYIFGICFVSIVASKVLHLWAHFFTIPASSFVLYLPTFFIFDFIAVCLVRLLLTQSKAPWTWFARLVGSIASYVLLCFSDPRAPGRIHAMVTTTDRLFSSSLSVSSPLVALHRNLVSLFRLAAKSIGAMLQPIPAAKTASRYSSAGVKL